MATSMPSVVLRFGNPADSESPVTLRPLLTKGLLFSSKPSPASLV